MNALSASPLLTRAEVQAALERLLAPLAAYTSPGSARVELGVNAAHYGRALAGLEGFARPLWGLAPLLAGGGRSILTERWVEGLKHGVNPQHAEYWGEPSDYSQALVEMPAIALATALVPDAFWKPLGAQAQANLTRWLLHINDRALVDNNWLSFRVIVNAALARLGQPHDRQAMQSALDRLQEFSLGGGWFSDGEITPEQDQVDYYVPFAFQFYGLLYAALSATPYGERERRLREQAQAFAPEFRAWFAADGSALPYGRSLTYRFAQGCFWGAAAFAGEEVLPWGELKGLWLRHLRWWLAQPILTDTGLLSTGYAYPNANMAEQYNSPASPYWALKFFLPLALSEAHPFWQAQETPLSESNRIYPQSAPGMLLCREAQDDHVFALAGRQHRLWVRHGAEKYGKFAYSTHFGFGVPGGTVGEEHAAPDSMLLLSDDGGRHWRGRETPEAFALTSECLYQRWQPFPDVTVDTWLLPHLPGHVRVHHIDTRRPLQTLEGGWALGANDAVSEHTPGEGGLRLSNEQGQSSITNLGKPRRAVTFKPDPNTNLLSPCTTVPTLRALLLPGRHWLACHVQGSRRAGEVQWFPPPAHQQNASEFRLLGHTFTAPPSVSSAKEGMT